MKVADLMSKKLLAAQSIERIENVLSRMDDHHIRHMPVVDEDGELLGIVSDRDLRLAVELRPDATLREVHRRYTKWVTPQTPATDAAARMHTDKIGCLPVLENNELVGIVTVTDMLEWLARIG